MARPTRQLRPGALPALLAEHGLSYQDVVARCHRFRPGSRINRKTVWEAATGRRPVAIETADCLVWGLDVRPSDLFVVPGLALEASQSGSSREL